VSADPTWLASLAIANPVAAAALRDPVVGFLAGEDGVDAAQRIEGLIASTLAPGHPAQEIADMLAQYRPGGEAGYLDRNDVTPPLRTLLLALDPKT
jgi:hypothetical protein